MIRILDLGAHDGFLSNWLARQLRDAGHDVHVDGVELNRHGVTVAQQRSERDGVPGTFKVGLAEDAADLFDPGSYDAVIAYELIEHVPQVDRLLDTCDEMVKPGGRVYVSTPDGTFGSGQNPHHLRVYRAVDLFDLMRARGTVNNFVVGPDGVSVISYAPSETARLGELAIYCGPGWQRWSPLDVERGGLGGSETAAVRLAEAMSDLGYTVTVYGEVEQTAFKQVTFRHHSTFDPLAPRAGVVLSRMPQMLDRKVNAPSVLLWCHDTDYGPLVTPDRAVDADAVLVLSRWHARHLSSLYPFLAPGQLRITRNGIAPEYFERQPAPVRHPHRAIFSSSPDRGLDLLLEMWPEVRFHVPDAELVYCYADVYNAVADQNASVASFRAKVAHLAKQPGVRNLGSLPQPMLAVEMRSAGVWLHPSFNSPGSSPFYETFCIGAVESAAAGCHQVMSDWGALAERDEGGSQRKIGLGPDGKLDREAWVAAMVDALMEPDPAEQSAAALEMGWEGVARDFHAIVQREAGVVAA